MKKKPHVVLFDRSRRRPAGGCGAGPIDHERIRARLIRCVDRLDTEQMTIVGIVINAIIRGGMVR